MGGNRLPKKHRKGGPCLLSSKSRKWLGREKVRTEKRPGGTGRDLSIMIISIEPETGEKII